MSNIQKALDALQPYVIGIRYLEGMPVVDAVFKEGWTVPEDSNIKKVKGSEELNYYMVYSEVNGIGIDELLAYVDKTIKLNVDREKKHELLRVKVNELKEVFRKNSLSKLTRLKFSFGDEDIETNISDLDIDEEIKIKPAPIIKKPIAVEEPEVEEVSDLESEPTATELPTKAPTTYLDENKNPIELSEEDKEILAEEARAERNRKALEAKKQNSGVKKIATKVELPPKRKIEMAIAEKDYDTDCECGPDEACSKCINNKDL